MESRELTRRAPCRRLAEAGCTPHQIQAITGHQMLAKAAMASVTKAFHQPEMANPDDELADIDFNALIPRNSNLQVALSGELEP